MIGHGVSLHIDGHHSDMIDGDIITGWAMLTGVGIATMAGIIIMAGTAGTIMLGVGDNK
jgi:hypothetical protein